MKYFIATEVSGYKIPKDVIPVNLIWKYKTIKNWVQQLCTLSLNTGDTLSGHSIGASLALIIAGIIPVKELLLYSPTPIFSQTIQLLDSKQRKYFGAKRSSEVKSIPHISCPITIYIGEKENENMLLNAKAIASVNPQAKIVVVKNKNHYDII